MMRSMQRLSWMAILAGAAASCTGPSPQAQEPVESDKIPVIPDAPGDAGETAPKAAGVGEAGGNHADSSAAATPAKNVAPAALGSGAAVRTVVPGALNIRQEPKMGSPVVGKLKKGDKVTATQCDKYWCKIGEGQYVGVKHLN